MPRSGLAMLAEHLREFRECHRLLIVFADGAPSSFECSEPFIPCDAAAYSVGLRSMLHTLRR